MPTTITIPEQRQDVAPFAASDMSFEERRRHLQEALDAWTAESRESADPDNEGYGYLYPRRYIVDLYDDYLIYEEYIASGSACFKVGYSIAEDYVVTFQTPERVIRTANYEPAPETIAETAQEATTAAAQMSEGGGDTATTDTGIVPAPAMRLTSKAVFDATEGLVLRTGKVSEVGQFPDKNIGFEESDFDKAAAAFVPVPLNNEHKPSLMDNALGTLKRVWRDGGALFGEVAVPKWLDDVFTRNGVARTVSLEWDRAKKCIVGCAWAKHPRISDAILMSAFSAAKGHSEANPDVVVKPATPPAPAPESKNRRESPAKGKTLMLFSAAEKGVAELLREQGKSDEEINAKIAALFGEQREQSIADEAANFAASVIQSEKAKPAARSIITSLFAQALRDDRAAGDAATITFSIEEDNDGKPVATTGSRVDMVKALFAAIEPDGLTTERMPASDERVTIHIAPQKTQEVGGTAAMSDERKAELIAMTPLGQAVLADNKVTMNGNGSAK